MGCLFAPLARTGTRPLSLEVGYAGSHADQYAGGHHRRRDPLRMPVASERLAAPAQALESLQDSRRRLRCPAGPRDRSLVFRAGLLPDGALRRMGNPDWQLRWLI